MTTDTKRLHRIGHAAALELGKDSGEIIKAAADEIERLRIQTAHETLVAKAATEEVERLREALKPIAAIDLTYPYVGNDFANLVLRARAAIKAKP